MVRNFPESRSRTGSQNPNYKTMVDVITLEGKTNYKHLVRFWLGFWLGLRIQSRQEIQTKPN